MIFMRFILFLVLSFYLLKLFFRWILGISSGKREPAGGAASRPEERRYSELTDQEIEDAEYEEIGTEES